MVAVDLVAPWLGLGRLAEQADEVHPFAILGPTAGDLADGVVQAHDVARRAKAAFAQRLFDQAQRGRALLLAQVLQEHAVSQEERVNVPPAPPGVGIDGELGLVPLLGVERLAQIERGAAYGLGGDAGAAKREETW